VIDHVEAVFPLRIVCPADVDQVDEAALDVVAQESQERNQVSLVAMRAPRISAR
jgi:hypothetical protein